MKKSTMTLFIDDMGSFKQPGVKSLDDALWYVNNARGHDGLCPMSMDEFSEHISNRDVSFTLES